MPSEPLNDAELLIVREGMAAASLLASEDLRIVFHSLQVEAFASFTESSPSDREKREQLYNLTQGLKAIEAELNMRVQRKAEIERRLDAENENPLIDDAQLGSF